MKQHGYAPARLAAGALILLCTACGGGGGGGSSPVAPTPQPPSGSTAANDALSVEEDDGGEIDVIANDDRVERDSANIRTPPSNGTASILAGVLAYSPDPDFNGSDSVVYEVNGDGGTVLTATVNITIIPVNDSPVANDDEVTIAPGASASIEVLDNDLDVDDAVSGLGITVTNPADNGSTAVVGGALSYQPVNGFSGCDRISYTVNDDDGAVSGEATASINVFAENTLATQGLSIPRTGYSTITFGGTDILASAPIEVPLADPASFVISLVGPDVTTTNALFIVDLETPGGAQLGNRESIFCEEGLCTAQVPKRPDIDTDAGTWRLRLGTSAASISDVAFDDYSLTIATRTGAEETCNTGLALTINPVVTGDLLTTDIENILTRFEQIASRNNVAVEIRPITTLTDPQFAEVDDDYRDPTTQALISQGAADSVNLFFIESFSGSSGGSLLGIASGIPGALGLESPYNGVLINGSATRGFNVDFYYRTTAEVSFHEMGHLLGLYHTSESDGRIHDVLDDTPECLPGNDIDNNNETNASECPDGLNIMFWENNQASEKTPLSDDQQHVIRRAIIGRFGSPGG